MFRKTLVAVAAAGALVLTGGVIAYASIPDASGVIHGCRKNSDGSVRVIDSDAGQTCANGWTALNWSQTGPQGPAGPAGPNLVPRSGATRDIDVSPGTQRVTVLCPEGYAVLSGGWSQGGDWVRILSSRPQYTPSEGWVFDIDNTAVGLVGMSFYVICTVV